MSRQYSFYKNNQGSGCLSHPKQILRIIGFGIAIFMMTLLSSINETHSNTLNLQGFQPTSTINSNLGEEKSISLEVGKTVVIDLPRSAADIVISNPEVTDGILRTARQVILIGKSIGSSDVLFFDQAGQIILTLDVRTGFDGLELENAVKRHFPGTSVTIERLMGKVVLSGTVSSSSEAQSIYKFVSNFASAVNAAEETNADESSDGGGSGADTVSVINRLTVQTDEQVMLKVRIAELSRSVTKRLGVNWEAGFQATSLALGSSWTGTLQQTLSGSFIRELLSDEDGASILVPNNQIADDLNDPLGLLRYSAIQPTDSLSDSISRTNNASAGLQTTLDTLLKALEQFGLVRTLAEPSLTAVSGEAASFLAGGEFPIALNTGGDLTIEFKKFGVSLDFIPVVLSGGRISLKVATEISELTSEGAITLGSISIPGLSVRRANTTIELPSGGAMVMAGLLEQSTRRLSSGLPGLRQLPVLGQLFRSEEFENEESELVILVTPYLVKPGQPEDFKLPTDGFSPGSDMDIFLLGKLHATYGAGRVKPETAQRALKAPFGYIME